MWDVLVFTKNQDLPLPDVVASRFLVRRIALMHVERLLLKKHFSVDGPPIGAWTSMSGLRQLDETPSGGDGGVNITGGGRRCRARDFYGTHWLKAAHSLKKNGDSRRNCMGRGKE